jgi:glutathione peroxidase
MKPVECRRWAEARAAVRAASRDVRIAVDGVSVYTRRPAHWPALREPPPVKRATCCWPHHSGAAERATPIANPFRANRIQETCAMTTNFHLGWQIVLALSAVAACMGTARAEEGKDKQTGPLAYKMSSLDGKEVDLAKYKGKVAVIVNVASACGLTPQYEQLQALHARYGKDGLAILGFPANEFGKQEPGTNAEISQFCKENYGVEFDMFAKVVVKGQGQCDLYKFLTSKETNAEFAGDITWNFEKFLVGRDGQVKARFSPRTKPDAEEVVEAIEAELAKK